MKAKTTILMLLRVDYSTAQDRRCLGEPLLIEMSPIWHNADLCFDLSDIGLRQ
jgi:hypothetical protein